MDPVDFDFARYIEQRRLCYKPVDFEDGRRVLVPGRLGFYDHCTDPSHKSINELEKTFYDGDGVFYFYDIKLCHTTKPSDYEKFIKEYKRRGQTQSFAVHISNTTTPYEYSQFRSLYDLEGYEKFIQTLIEVDADIIVEISNKRLSDTPADEMKKIENIYDMLESATNVRHYMVRHEIYKSWTVPERGAPKGLSYRFDDDYENLIKEVKRYDENNIIINTQYNTK
jgi:hypothetical protein